MQLSGKSCKYPPPPKLAAWLSLACGIQCGCSCSRYHITLPVRMNGKKGKDERQLPAESVPLFEENNGLS